MATFVKLFQRRFVPLILDGRKRTTIRPRPKGPRRPERGDILDARAWTGKPYRSKQERLGRFEVTRVWDVTVSQFGIQLDDFETYTQAHHPGGEREGIARRDGFNDWSEMAQWFNEAHGLPFDGILIEWSPLNLGYDAKGEA